MQRSSVTLQSLPTIRELVKELLDNYMDVQGYGDFYDLTKVIYSTKHEDIVRELITQAELINEKAMLQAGLCPDCGDTLVNRHINATREDPAEDYAECPSCHDDYVRGIA